MTLGRIVVDLLAKTGSFETDINRSAKLAEKRAKEIDRQFKAAAKAIGVALAAAATAAAVAIKNSIDRMDELSKSAQRANMPTEDFSRLAYAGTLADVAMADLTKSMGKLAKAQGDAAQGLTTQVAGFEMLGIAFQNTDGSLRKTFDVFLDFADAFQRHKGSPEVMALGMQVFGRSFQNLIPLLKDGRAGLQGMADEADRLGFTISTEAGHQAEEFNDNLTRLKTSAMGLANAVAGDLLPDLVDLSQGFLDTSSNGNRLKDTADDLTGFLRGLAKVAHTVSSAFEIMGTSMASSAVLARSLMQLLSGDSQGSADSVRDAYSMIGDEWREAFGTGKPKRDPRFSRVSGRATGAWERDESFDPLRITDATPGKSGADKEAESLARAYQSMNERLDEQHALFGMVGEAARVRYETEHGALVDLTDAEKSLLIAKAERNDLLTAEAEMMDKVAERDRDAAQAAREHTQAVDRLLSDMRFEIDLTRAQGAEKEKMIALRYAGVDAMSAEGRAVAELADELYAAREAEMVLLDMQATVADFAASALSDFGSIGDAFADMADRMKRIAAQLLAEKAIQWLFNALGSMFAPQAAPSKSFAGDFGNNTGWLSDGSYGGAGGGMFGTGGGASMPTGGGQVMGGNVSVSVINNSGAQAKTTETTGPDGTRQIEVLIDGMVGKSLSRGQGAKVLQNTYGIRRMGTARG